MDKHEPRPIEPPTGLVTLVFTDVQGSTGIWERSPEVMRQALATHDAVMRETLEALGGYEVKTEGDAFMVAFTDAQSAVRWCLAVQERLMRSAWDAELLQMSDAAEVIGPSGQPLFRGLRVRMGVHAGVPECKPDPKTGRMDYFGPMVNRAARVGGAAHGGQILVSGWVWERISSRLPLLGSPEFCDLGLHRLKGLETRERLVMVLPASLASRRFPSPKTLNPHLTNLQPPAASFIGREADLEEIDRLIARPFRLITVTGPGGMGKTRLACRYGSLRLEGFSGSGEGGVWFCDAAEATTPGEICESVGHGLGVPLAAGLSGEAMVAHLGQALAGRGRILLIVDNFEQVAQHAAATLGRWLQAAPEAVFLVTSRESLRLKGEAVLDLAPLPLPQEAADAGESAAVRLFRERAEAVRPGSIRTPADLALAAQIVRRLDGIPLAIELAAARMGIFSPADLASRLARHLDLLAASERDAPSRQATLRKALDWSWNLLEPWERQAFAQCSVFHGGFDLEAAEQILDVSSHPGAPAAFEIVQALRNKSLLRSFESAEVPGRLRLAMYVPVQDYAREQFLRQPDREAVIRRHATYFVKLGRLLTPGFPGGGGDGRLHQLAVEQENLRAVHRWAVSREPPTRESASLALEAALALDPLFTTRGPFPVRMEFLEAAMSRAEAAGVEPALLAWACEARGRTLLIAGDPPAAEAIYERGLVLARSCGEKKAEAFLQRNIGLMRMISGTRMEEARAGFEAGLALLREIGDQPCVGSLLGDLGCYWLARRELDRAVEFLEQGLQVNRQVGNQLMEGLALANLAIIHQELGRFDQAEGALNRARSLGEELGDRRLHGFALGYLGLFHQETSRFAEAADFYRGALRLFQEIGERSYHGFIQAALGGCLARLGSLEEAGAIFAAADPGRPATISAPFAQAERLHLGIYEASRAVHRARTSRPEEAAAATERARSIYAEGKEGSLESEDVRLVLRLLSQAIQELPSIPGNTGSPPHPG